MNAIEQGLPGVRALGRPPASGWGAFLQSLLIILREGFEAITDRAVVAFPMKTGHRERLRSIWTACCLALGASALTAVVLATVLRAAATREVIEGHHAGGRCGTVLRELLADLKVEAALAAIHPGRRWTPLQPVAGRRWHSWRSWRSIARALKQRCSIRRC
jgi:hypothetical protein